MSDLEVRLRFFNVQHDDEPAKSGIVELLQSLPLPAWGGRFRDADGWGRGELTFSGMVSIPAAAWEALNLAAWEQESLDTGEDEKENGQ